MQDINNFTFFKSWIDAAEDLDDAERLEWYDAIIAYHFAGIEPTRETNCKVVVALFKSNKPVMDKAIAKRRANQQNGKKGGRPKTRALSDLTESEMQRKNELQMKIVTKTATEQELQEYDELITVVE